MVSTEGSRCVSEKPRLWWTRQFFPDDLQQVSEGHAECSADRRQDFGRRLTGTAFDGGEVGERDPRRGCYFFQRGSLGESQTPQAATQGGAKKHGGIVAHRRESTR